jgi:hypothetical protein
MPPGRIAIRGANGTGKSDGCPLSKQPASSEGHRDRFHTRVGQRPSSVLFDRAREAGVSARGSLCPRVLISDTARTASRRHGSGLPGMPVGTDEGPRRAPHGDRVAGLEPATWC